MSSSQDITKKSRRESESFVSEPQPENTARACDDDYPDRIVHHNERPVRDRPVDQSEPQPDPAPASEEETSKQGGEIPFSNWDGEEGPRP